MATDLSAINAALTRTGNEPITSLMSSAIGAKIASENYENLVESHLSVYPWKRASKTAQLDRLDPDDVGDPPEPWTAAYQIPEDEIGEIRTVKVGGMPIEYEVQGDIILCNAAEDDDVILHYVWRVSETDWPAWFFEGMVRRLEALFLRSIGERHREAEARDEAADEWFRLAKNRDSQSQTARDPNVSGTLAARRG